MKKGKKISLKRPNLFKRLKAPYRMVLINDHTLEEVAVFRLTKRSVYILASTLFVVTVIVTLLILLFTPLKYYIPGYGSHGVRKEVIRLRQTVDSLTDNVQAGQRQLQDIRSVLTGDYAGLEDTTVLEPDRLRKRDPGTIFPKPEEIKTDALRKRRKSGS